MSQCRRFVKDLRPGESLDEVFLVRDKDLRKTQTGSMYVACVLADKTGTVPGRMWQASEAVFATIPSEGFGRVKARTESYRGQLQVVIESIAPVDPDAADLADFLPTTRLDPEAMWAELRELLGAIENVHVAGLVRSFLDDPTFEGRFKKAPAAAQMHHAYIGGLLEHTLGVVRLAEAVAPLYRDQLNKDLLLAGAFLHDIGKIEELRADVTMGYTDRGNLVGHIVVATIWVEERAAQVADEAGEPFPERILDLVQHIILAHHGTHEYGSPKVPAIPEAQVLHYLDNLDAKVHMFTRAKAEDQDASSSFTGFSRPLGAKIYKRSFDLPE